MADRTDHELLGEYARDASEAAFTRLVTRYVNLVYSTALRFTDNPHHAEEITQAVFVILACKAGTLSPRVVLSGWLYQVTRHAAANLVRGEVRRQQREQEAYMQTMANETPDRAAWEQMAPLLDAAMGHLGETDRNAVVLSFFENRTAAEVAARLQLSEAAAHKRVSRALEKLRKYFARHGVESTTAGIAGTISAHSLQVAPATLAHSVAAVALTKGAVASGSTLTLIKGALKIMAWSKAKTAVIAGVVLILAAGTTTLVVKRHAERSREKVLPPARYAFRQESDRLVGDAKMAGLACFLYAGDHQNRLPASFAQLNAWDQQTKLSDADWEFVASGTKDGFTTPEKTIYFMEKQPRQAPDGSYARVYATVDGRVFLVTSPDRDFTAVEKQRGFLIGRLVP
ncbi:MAG TPA: sigma-70 family RNA polymerase sigma factor [Dongiaceae bacterium]|jgi:RNA polymerase sigma factor (sigma-70 family)|nr:sigma-70 family RNA polymerase sigma factor [Dongiaceae bacterium]